MTPQNPMSPGMENRGNSIEQMQEFGLNFAYILSSFFTLLFEMLLRPFYGTRCFNPIVMLGASLLWLILPAFGSIGTAVGHLVTSVVPFVRYHDESASAMFDLGSLSALFFLGCFLHSLRLWRRMIDMSREPHSEFIGRSVLPFFALLPYGKRFHVVRIVYEPLLLVVASIVLSDFRILSLGAARLMFLAGPLLSVKNSIDWYRGWVFVRVLLDAKFAAPIVAAMAEGTATNDQLASVHLASFPKNLPTDVKTAAIAHMTATLSPETARLVTPLEVPAKPVRTAAAFVQPLAGFILCVTLGALLHAQNPAPSPAAPTTAGAQVVNQAYPSTTAIASTQTTAPQGATATGGSTGAQAPPAAMPPAIAAMPNAYIANLSADTVSVLNLDTEKVVATIHVGMKPIAAAMTPSGKYVYIANRGNGNLYGSNGTSNVSVIDTGLNKVIATIDLHNPKGFATALAMAPDGEKLYVSNMSTNKETPAGKVISVISTATNQVIASIPFAPNMIPGVLAIRPDGKELWVGDYDAVSVVVISLVSNQVTAIIRLHADNPTPGQIHAELGNCGQPEGIAFGPNGLKAYVACFERDSFVAIDTLTHQVRFLETFLPRLSFSALAASPSGARLYAVVGDQGVAYAVDTATEAKVLSEGITPDGKALFLGASPMGVAVTRDEARVIIANRGSNTVTLIDARKNAVMASIPVGNEPTAVAVQPAPMTNVGALPSETRATPCGVAQNPSTPNKPGGFTSHIQYPTTPQVIVRLPLGMKIGLTPIQIGKKAQPNTAAGGAQGNPNGCGTGAPATNTSITAPRNR